MSGPRNVYELRMTAPDEWLNANHRLHWATQARRTKAWRDATRFHARAAQLPTGLDRVHIQVTIHPKDRRRRDIHNLMPSVKALVDGLVDYGLIADDDDTHLTGPDLRPGEPSGMACAVLVTTITDLGGAA